MSRSDGSGPPLGSGPPHEPGHRAGAGPPVREHGGAEASRRRTLRIGLTGPIGCGKSTVARWLAALGAAVVDADVVAREVTAPGQPAHDAILDRFGRHVAGPDGTVDRAALAALVFGDPAALADLEAIVHPAVRPRILAAIEAADSAAVAAVVVEAIKLVEGGLAALCDEVWLVTCDSRAQRERLLARGMAAADADRRIAAQGDLDSRLRSAATRVIETSGLPEEMAGRVAEALEQALGTRRA